MNLLRLLAAAAFVLGASPLSAADKTAAKTAQPAAGKTAAKNADKNNSDKATPVGDMPPSPPRLTYQGVKGQPGLANYENRQGKVPADKYDVVTKALADAKLP